MSLPYYPSPAVEAFGERVSEALFDACVRKSVGGALGGCPEYNPTDFDADVLPYVEAYLLGNHNSVAILYAAMRHKELS